MQISVDDYRSDTLPLNEIFDFLTLERSLLLVVLNRSAEDADLILVSAKDLDN